MISLIIWSSFVFLILLLLFLDLGVFHRKDHVISVREAMGWSAFWIGLALIFNIGIYYIYDYGWITSSVSPGRAAMQFLTGYLIEKSLSLDNIFVIAVILGYFRVPAMRQHRVLFWGILGALVMRAVMIFAGVALIQKFEWMIYLLGLLLIFTAIKMFSDRDKEPDIANNRLLLFLQNHLPITSKFNEGHFTLVQNGKRLFTPLFLALVLVEATDLLFAIDSIPAILAITTDPFIVFTSNVFAILGLRSLYFALHAMLEKFYYLKYSLVFILAFVGLKMLLTHFIHLHIGISLGVVLGALVTGFLVSIYKPKTV